MVPFEKAKRILHSDGSKYTDEQIRQIMEFLSHLAKINVEFILKKMEKEDPLNPAVRNLFLEDDDL